MPDPRVPNQGGRACRACGAGPLVPRRRHRFAGGGLPVLPAIGYLLLAAGLGGAAFASASWLSAAWSADALVRETVDQQARQLADVGLPPEVIEEFRAGDGTAEIDRFDLTEQQDQWLTIAVGLVQMVRVGAPEAAAESRRRSLTIGLGCLAVVPVGVVLVWRRTVLACAECGQTAQR